MSFQDCDGQTCETANCLGECSVNLSYQKIYSDVWPDMTDAINHQFEWQEFVIPAGSKVLAITDEFSVPLTTSVPGTELYPASVFGYNNDGSLDLNGGKAKSYDSCYTQMDVRYHGAPSGTFPFGIGEIPLTFITSDAVKNYSDRIVSYFTNRGYSMPAPDQFEQFSNQYIWQYPEGQAQFSNLSGGGYVAMRPIFEVGVPKYIDLHAAINTTFVLNTFEPDLLNHKNGHGYPVRIPITTDFCGTFQQMYNVEPIAYYDERCSILTIHIPDNGSSYRLVHYVVNSGYAPTSYEYTVDLLAFDGSFQVLRKDGDKIVPSGFNDMAMFAQVSETVYIKSHIDFVTGSEDTEYVWPIRAPVFSPDDETVYYIGMVCPLMSGSTPSFDVYAVPFPNFESYTFHIDPLLYPPTQYCGNSFNAGDNPVTKVKEKYSNGSSITCFDIEWNLISFGLPHDMITTKTSFPENVSTAPVPISLSNDEAYRPVIMHEFTHSTQFNTGIIPFLPVEGMAVGIEMDTRASGDVFLLFRPPAFTFEHLSLTRGEITMMGRISGNTRLTYGLGMLWHYTQDQFDPNMQLQRRIGDILASETLGPAMIANDIPDAYEIPSLNRTGSSAALKTALQELFNKDIKDVWNDFSIALVLLRNNKSIPNKYRVNFPYWIYNENYSGYQTLLDSVSILYGPDAATYTNWWQQLNENKVLSLADAYSGQTFIRTLPKWFSQDLYSLTSVSFNVDRCIKTIKITITTGEWCLSLLQFTSDGTENGSFIIDGPYKIYNAGTHVFKVRKHCPRFSKSGNIRLVCANVTFNGTGTNLSEYFTPEEKTGTITIVSK